MTSRVLSFRLEIFLSCRLRPPYLRRRLGVETLEPRTQEPPNDFQRQIVQRPEYTLSVATE